MPSSPLRPNHVVSGAAAEGELFAWRSLGGRLLPTYYVLVKTTNQKAIEKHVCRLKVTAPEADRAEKIGYRKRECVGEERCWIIAMDGYL